MQTKDYTTDLLPLIKSLCGVEFANLELPRIKDVTNGYVPWTQAGLDSVDTFVIIHRSAPYIADSAQNFDFYVDFTGAKIVDGDLNSASAYATYKKQTTSVYGDGTNGTTSSIPDEWFEYLAHGTYSDWLRSEGQMEKSQIADAEAMDKLTDELIRIDEMRSSALVSTRIQTNANMQSRWSY